MQTYKFFHNDLQVHTGIYFILKNSNNGTGSKWTSIELHVLKSVALIHNVIMDNIIVVILSLASQ